MIPFCIYVCVYLFDLGTTKQLIGCLIIKFISFDDLLSNFSQSHHSVKVSVTVNQLTFILIAIFFLHNNVKVVKVKNFK